MKNIAQVPGLEEFDLEALSEKSSQRPRETEERSTTPEVDVLNSSLVSVPFSSPSVPSMQGYEEQESGDEMDDTLVEQPCTSAADTEFQSSDEEFD
jgi:hypothetical protein